MSHTTERGERTEMDMVFIEAMAEAIVVALQPFARAGCHGLDGISACVGVICAIAKEHGEYAGHHGKRRVVTAAIKELQAQVREWEG